MLKKNTIYLLFIIFLTFTSYLFGARPQNELNIYSGRKLSLIEPLIKKFENDTNIKINIITINKVAKTSTNPGHMFEDSVSRCRIDLATIFYFFLKVDASF